MTEPIITRATDRTPAQRIGRTDVSLESRSWRARLPFGGLVWNRPAAVIVRQDGVERRLPIVDVTRRRQVALLAAGLLCLLAGLWLGRGPQA